MYCLDKEKFYSCFAYLLASPLPGYEYALLNVAESYGDLFGASGSYDYKGYGVRPLAKLPTDIKAQKGSDEKWTFTN